MLLAPGNLLCTFYLEFSKIFDGVRQGCTNTGRHVAVATNYFYSGAWNVDVTPGFLEKVVHLWGEMMCNKVSGLQYCHDGDK